MAIDANSGSGKLRIVNTNGNAAVSSSVKGIILDLNGNVGIGTATPTAPLQVVGLVTYASDAAAGTGGLTAGALYKDSGGGVHVKL
jgi:hypothetical protein